MTKCMKRIRNVAVTSLAVLFILMAFGCRKDSKSVSRNDFVVEEAAYDYGAVAAMEMPMPAPTAVNTTMRVAQKSSGATYQVQAAGMNGMESGALNDEAEGETERKLVKTGSISFEVENLDTTDALVTQWAEKFGGYVFSSGSNTTNAWYTVKIPSTEFDNAMNSVGNIGDVKSRSISTEDVSDSYYDLKTRLETRKIMRDRLSDYLQRAENIDNLLKIESELNSVISDIEYMEGSMKRLNGRIDYSTININASLPFRTNNEGEFTWPDFGDGTRRFFSSVVDYFGDFVGLILYLIICGVPTLAFIIFLYWLLFGKLGILIRIFKKVSRQRAPKPPKAPKTSD